MKKNLTELVFILDRSGSMSGLESDTIGGFNAMLEKQKKAEGEAYVTTVLFNNRLVTVHDRVDLQQISPMTEKDYTVGGCTALLDAVGETVKHIADIHKYAREEDVPEHTLFVITTDGMENASRRYTAADVKKMIEEKKEKNGWEFIFFGANIDVVEAAEDIGIDADHAVEYISDPKGTRESFRMMCEAVTAARQTEEDSSEWVVNCGGIPMPALPKKRKR
ncbi:MAG: VWA domain-containing protein [Clostridia bacterium]|nr:VWA domain-containing protein [Clostridia bacterium]